MAQVRFSLSETRSLQEEARRKYASGKYSLADYLAVIINNPLKFTSAKRSQVVLTREKGKIRVVASQSKLDTENGN